jgi:peptidoglycan/xylan/chitin deacetylase (PgdA/CDA1 family)
VASIVFLMYHELKLPGRHLCQSEPGYTRYVLPLSSFREQMQALKNWGWQGISVSEAVTYPQKPSVAITFDDGCETDLIAVAPVLAELGFQATFYVTAGFIGSSGYMSAPQLRSLHDMGFEIGCHSMTHPYLPALEDSKLRDETAGAKQVLEQMILASVQHFSCPGGRWNPRVADAIKAAGFRTMATSDPTPNTPGTPQFALGRVAMLRSTSLETFPRICRGQGLLWTRLQGTTRDLAKRALGNSTYESLRRLLLAKGQPADSED